MKKLLIINSIGSVLQTLGISLILFILYRYLLNQIGPEKLGVWSLILAATSLAEIGKLGLTGSVVKFVAKYVTLKDYDKTCKIIETAFVSSAFLIGLFSLAVFGLSRLFLVYIVDKESISLAFEILPYACFSFWLIILTDIIFSGLDGLQLIYLRNIILLAASLLNLLMCFIFVPKWGLVGVAYAKVLQSLTMLFVAYTILIIKIPGRSKILFRWDKTVFKEIWLYGLNFQAISILRMALDPVTKSLISRFGGLAMVGYYEMANRLVLQVRGLMVSANQAIIPIIAGFTENDTNKIIPIYKLNYKLFAFISLPVFTLLIISSPLISVLWLGTYQYDFVLLLMMLSLGWCLNSMNVPAYFSFIGTGELAYNVLSSFVLAILNVSLGFILGFFFYGFGVVLGWVLALAIGSSIVYIAYHIRMKIPFIDLWPENVRVLSVVCLLYAIISFKLNLSEFSETMVQYQIMGCNISGTIIILLLFWFNPFRKDMYHMVFDKKAESV